MPLLPPGLGTPDHQAGRRQEAGGDSLTDLLTHGHYADAGRALGFGFEAAAEPASLIADLDNLDAPQLRVDAAATQPEQLAAAQPGADLGEEMVTVERAAGGQEAAELLRGKVRRRSWPKIRSGLIRGLGASTSRTGLLGIRRSRRAASRMRSRMDRHAITPLWLSLPSRSCCQRKTIEGVIWRSCRRPK